MSSNSDSEGRRQKPFPEFLNFVKSNGATDESPPSSIKDRLKQFLPQIAEANAKLAEEMAHQKAEENQTIWVEEMQQNIGQLNSSDDEEENSSSEQSSLRESSDTDEEDESSAEEADEKEKAHRPTTKSVQFDVHLIKEEQPETSENLNWTPNGNGAGEKATPLVEEIEKNEA